MATRNHERLPLSGETADDHLIRWTGLLNGDDGEWIRIAGADDRSVQVFGTFGAAGTVVIEGSNEPSSPANPAGLNDSRGEGNALSFAGADLRQVLETSVWIRPHVTGGDGTTSLTVLLRATRRR